eukprot:scaffold31968_cov128-Skeletonema_dohrnii-CCMP3373.AAC.2
MATRLHKKQESEKGGHQKDRTDRDGQVLGALLIPKGGQLNNNGVSLLVGQRIVTLAAAVLL